MDYAQTLDYLFIKTPMFQQKGLSAYKVGLDNIKLLDANYGHPHRAYKTIHVGGTNGKGSVSHSLAAVLQSAGYKVGLYTSPHLKDFSERIRVDGCAIDQAYVIEFVEHAQQLIEKNLLSFYEVTTMMAFSYFKDQAVDVAIIEVGLGGRLDSTNIIHPVLSVITNISLDHVQFLGDTLEKIAEEKAGIIKKNVPVVVGEASDRLRKIFCSRDAPVVFAEDVLNVPPVDFELKGLCQDQNIRTILSSIERLQATFSISKKAIEEGLSSVCKLTGLRGRWQELGQSPLVITDTAHNEAGIAYVVKHLHSFPYKSLRIVWGMVKDKDIEHILSLLPLDAIYYFCQAEGNRSLDVDVLNTLACEFNLKGSAFENPQQALSAAKNEASAEDVIFVGGSTFVVAEVL